MVSLPDDIRDLIFEYKNGLEHYERFKPCLYEIPIIPFTVLKLQMNQQFRMLFFPGWYSQILGFPIPSEIEFD